MNRLRTDDDGKKHRDMFEPTDENFNEMFNEIISMVESSVFTPDGTKTYAPTVFLKYRTANDDDSLSEIKLAVFVIDGDFNNGETKNEVMYKIGREIFKYQLLPVGIFFASEAWMSRLNDGKTMPSQDPNRQEVIICAGRTVSNKHSVGLSIPIKRNKDGTIMADGEKIKTDKIQTGLLERLLAGYFEFLLK